MSLDKERKLKEQMNMKTKILLTLLLASGMAFAQSGSSSPGSSDQSQQPSSTSPSTSPNSNPATDQSQQPSATSPSTNPSTDQQPSVQQPPSAQQQTPSTNPDQNSQTPTTSGAINASPSGQSTLSGCLKQSGSNWVLVSNGQRTPVTGDDATLKPNDGRQVQLKGNQASDGSFQVSEVVLLSDACTPDASTSSNIGAAPGS